MAMECTEILSALRELSSEKYKANVVKMGIPEESSIGVSTGDIRKLAKEIGKSGEIARELWLSGYHEARLLAVLLMDKKTTTLEECQELMNDVISWDLCDHLCKNLIIKIKGYQKLIDKWCDSNKTYLRRGAFTLIASAAIHEKELPEDQADRYLDLIRHYPRMSGSM